MRSAPHWSKLADKFHVYEQMGGAIAALQRAPATHAPVEPAWPGHRVCPLRVGDAPQARRGGVPYFATTRAISRHLLE